MAIPFHEMVGVAPPVDWTAQVAETDVTPPGRGGGDDFSIRVDGDNGACRGTKGEGRYRLPSVPPAADAPTTTFPPMEK